MGPMLGEFSKTLPTGGGSSRPFLSNSWIEHLRQHRRVTNADRLLQDHLRGYLSDEPKVTHMIAAEPAREVQSVV